jgi:hypothetical protein
MRQAVRIAVSAFALCISCGAAFAMATVTMPKSGDAARGANLAPGADYLLRDPASPESVKNPYTGKGFTRYGMPMTDGVEDRDRNGKGGFLNADPFDPNSVVNSYDRYRYANPYPFDPVYNPYGQGSSPSAPMAPYVQPGHGIPYGR